MEIEARQALYRYEDRLATDEGHDPLLIEVRVVKITPKGCWVTRPSGVKRFMRTDRSNGRRWAQPTKGKALWDYVQRKRFQQSRQRQELEVTGLRLRAARDMLAGMSLKETKD